MSLVNYTSIKIKENNEPLVDLSKFNFIIEPKYFIRGLSKDPRILLREGIAKKLIKIQNKLKNLRFKIWDGFRPRIVQNNIYQKYYSELKLFNPKRDEKRLKLEVGKFVSPPFQIDRIPPHLTGGAVDLTLVDENKKELDMGTEFDFFGSKASSYYYEIYNIDPKVTKNRRILQEAMKSENFTLDEDEWWHFDWGNQMWALKNGGKIAFYGEIDNNYLKKGLDGK